MQEILYRVKRRIKKLNQTIRHGLSGSMQKIIKLQFIL